MKDGYLQVKDIVVLGLGLSGQSALKFLHSENLVTRCFDDDQSKEDIAQALGSIWMKPEDGLLSNAVVLLVSPGVGSDHPVIREAQEREIDIINDIELFARMHQDATIVGITGTNGKSTLTSLTCHILNELGVKAVATGNFGIPIFDVDMEENPLLVLELSSYQLERCPSLQTDVSVLINVTEDHLDRYENSFTHYMQTKLNILDALKPGGLMVMGSTLAHVSAVKERLQQRSEDTLQFFVDAPVQHDGLYGLTLAENEYIYIDDRFALRGFAGAELMSLALGIVASIKPSFFTETAHYKQKWIAMLESFQPLAHRQEKFAEWEGVQFINDSKATNPESTAMAIECYNHIFWIAGGKDKHTAIESVYPYLEKVEAVYLIGEACTRFAELLREYSDQLKIKICENLEEASRQAIADAVSFSKNGVSATVLLSPMCSSFDQFQNFMERGLKFKKCVEHILSMPEYSA